MIAAELIGSRTALVVLLALFAWLSPSFSAAELGWRVLPEMAAPDGVVVDAPAVRAALAASTEGVAAVAAIEHVFRRDWESLRELDWRGLSRYQVEATAGWEAPISPGPLEGRVLGRDADGRLHVEVRGPRLPALYDIVFRYVYAFGTYDPLTREVGGLLVTIRGWVEE